MYTCIDKSMQIVLERGSILWVRLSQKSTLQNHIYRNTFTEFSAHLATSSDDLTISSDDLTKPSGAII